MKHAAAEGGPVGIRYWLIKIFCLDNDTFNQKNKYTLKDK